jgi:hypothetical protein
MMLFMTLGKICSCPLLPQAGGKDAFQEPGSGENTGNRFKASRLFFPDLPPAF